MAGKSPSVVGNFEGMAAHFHEEGGVRRGRFGVFDLESMHHAVATVQGRESMGLYRGLGF